jgi:pimeloyl-ACP methyl ester carboxylesterase
MTFGSVLGTPGLPDDFGDVFTSRWIDVPGVRLHAVTGGEGPPLLLLGGWPQTWYAWREIMLPLARDFSVVAVDPRGVGLSSKPRNGYDTGTLANDIVALMPALGHEHFAMVGHDVGMWTAFALAADHPDRIVRLALAEAVIPGLAPSPPLLTSDAAVQRVWHFVFNRLESLNEELVRGRERLFFGHQFATKAVQPLPEHAVDVYVRMLASDADALRSSFEFYRALDVTIEQNARRRDSRLRMPVLTIAGAGSLGDGMTTGPIPALTDDLTNVVLPDCGHYPAEEAPEHLLAALTAFLAPYRNNASKDGGPRPPGSGQSLSGDAE